MIDVKSNKKNIIPIIILVLFLFESFTNSPDSALSNVLFIIMIISLIAAEFFERKNKYKRLRINNKEVILATKDSDYYISMIVILFLINIYMIICTFGKNIPSLDKIIILNGNYSMLIGVILLLITYGYFYFSSNQEVYSDGIKLMDNKFVSKNDIVGIICRETIIKRRKLIEITCKDNAIGFSNIIRIKCKSNDEFNKVIDELRDMTGVLPKTL